MAIYRASPQDGVAWVTGASTGIGRALALALAREGYAVAATARSEDKLASLVGETGGLSGRIVPFPCDVIDRDQMCKTVARIEADLGPIALAVFNAGNFYSARGDALDVDNFIRSYQINLFGTIHGMVPVVERMRGREHGHIAIMGSVTGYGGIPISAAYGSSKAALNNMAESLKFDFDKMNIRIQVVNPGFVDTPLTRRSKLPMPALMDVGAAADRIAKGLRTGGFELTFPRRLTWPLKLVNLLPHPLYFALMNLAMGRRKRPARKLK